MSDYHAQGRERTRKIRKFASDTVIQWNLFDERGKVWRVELVDSDVESAHDHRATVTDGEMMRFLILSEHPYTKVECRFIPPFVPTLSGNSAYAPLSDLVPRSARDLIDGAKAGSAFDRMEKASADVATRFWKTVVTATRGLVPLIQQTLEDRAGCIQKQRDVANELLHRYPDMKRYNDHGDSITIGTPGVDLPGFSVGYNGTISVTRGFSMTLKTACALYEAAERSPH